MTAVIDGDTVEAFCHGIDAGLVSDIQLYNPGACSLEVFGFFRLACCTDDLVASVGEFLRQRQSDASIGAGDQYRAGIGGLG